MTPEEMLREDVAKLAALDRRTTGDGERASARWIRDRLVATGADEVRVRPFRTPSSWSPAHLAHVAMAVATSLLPVAAGRAAAAAVVASYELEVSGRNQWVRRLLPAGHGVSVTARVPCAEPARTLVLVAHHDAAQGGWLWHPRAVAASRGRSRRTGAALPSHLPMLAALSLAAAPSRRLRAGGRLLLGVCAGLIAQSACSRTAPGANDNATGVAAVLELTRRLAAEPPPGTEVVAVFPGGEEVGNSGMRAWLREEAGRLDPARTLVVNVDAVGSGGHLVVARREGLTATYDDRDVQFAHDAAVAAGIELRTIALPNVSDAFAARRAGLRTVSLLSYDDGWIANLHRPQDTVANVGWSTVHDAVALVERIVASWAGEDGGNDD